MNPSFKSYTRVFSKGVLFPVFCLLAACTNNRSKENFMFSGELPNCKGLYVFVYKIASYGVYGGDIKVIYLTDSISFRKYIGKCDDREIYTYECKGDSVYVKKESSENYSDYLVIDSFVLDLKQLRKAGAFD